MLFELNCPTCDNSGSYPITSHGYPITDETGEIVDIQYEIEEGQCEFCYMNKSSVFNGGTKGMVDFGGILDEAFVASVMTVDFDGVGRLEAYREIKDMHGKHIAVFGLCDNTVPEYVYKLIFTGLCLGNTIFEPSTKEKHKITLGDHRFIYFDDFTRTIEVSKYDSVEYHVKVNLGMFTDETPAISEPNKFSELFQK